MTSGIYQIKNTLNGKCYIGSAVNLRKRWRDHLRDLCRGEHFNHHLQAAFDKYGEGVFIFKTLERIEPKMLLEREQHYLDTLKPEYNISPTAGSPLGVRHTDEARANMSTAHTGERNHNYGKHLSEEIKRKIGEALMGHQGSMQGKRHNDETKRKIRKALMGHQVSEETRAKQSAAKRGKPSSFKGKHHTAMTKQKISNIKKGTNVGKQNHFYGKHHSEAIKRKISVALRAYWRRKRAEEQETP